MNFFQRAEAMLRAARVKAALQEDITYVGDHSPQSGIVDTITKATRGRSERETVDSQGVLQISQSVDWLIDDLPLALAKESISEGEDPPALEDLDLKNFLPKRGHYIVDSLGRRYEVTGEPCYREHGRDGRTLRVYTRQVFTIDE